MSRLPSSRKIISVLLKNGFVKVSQKGSHAKFRKDSLTVIVPTPKKEIPLGTARSIAQQAGLKISDFQ
jgi:predicted RNA binding protein YcfA (HicA-like mRNA interferase family)